MNTRSASTPTTPRPRLSTRVSAIWQDCRNAQRRLDQLNRPWMSNRTG